ncbi:T9SS type A sorting domain-containing protein [Flavihumibacter petaseus]|uniref:Secretion system C-terminal sorting domain-containing protein n=1 Tax=Flavihumibacter petaseus NBRC 106054 TaxID=1220578 RepID=A0A0E9MW06_9BACT|nr:T9SS type A sorting domain-containing protein [Flavihumibacter petaseus]GAO41310.1 hypothetical protein FPE01S_01_03220 [Flavihumibacter petaseus NBRC 106054]
MVFAIEGMAQTSQPQPAAVRFYPNPAISQITFDFPRQYDKTYSFEVFNFLGKKVFEQKNVNPKTTIDLSQYFRGIYIYQLRDKTGKIVESGRFQVTK